MRIEIKRRKRNSENSYVQVFEYEPVNKNETILNVLNNLNLREQLKDINGETAEKIAFKQSCRQKKCGNVLYPSFLPAATMRRKATLY